MKAIGIGIIALIAILGLSWAFTGNDFFLYKVFAPKMEQVRRDTYKESQAYNDGMAGQIQSMQYKYLQSNDEAKGALGPVILSTVGTYDTNKLPPDLRDFIRKVRSDMLVK